MEINFKYQHDQEVWITIGTEAYPCKIVKRIYSEEIDRTNKERPIMKAENSYKVLCKDYTITVTEKEIYTNKYDAKSFTFNNP